MLSLPILFLINITSGLVACAVVLGISQSLPKPWPIESAFWSWLSFVVIFTAWDALKIWHRKNYVRR